MNSSSADASSHELVEPPVELTAVRYSTDALDGRVATITLARAARRNAWTELMRHDIVRCVERASRDPRVRCVLITGDPAGRAFCVGADLSPASPSNPSSLRTDVPDGRRADQQHWRDGGGQAALAIVRSTKPVLCALNGDAVGIGMTLALACDVTVAARDARCGFVFGRRGLTMEACSSYLLARAVGHKRAMELVLTGRVFRAHAAPPGLFNYVVDDGAAAVARCLELAAEMCDCSPVSNALNRTLVWRNGHSTSPERAHLAESKSLFWVARQPDVAEGIASFLEKRAPAFPMDPFRDSPDWLPWWDEQTTKARL